MTNFWQNLKRFPKFIISVIIGLITVIMNPIIQRSNSSQTQALLFILSLIILTGAFFTLKAMLQLN
uniref:Uncharacterized protein ycf33 n=1 Tax=Sciadococcus taiwanensis TaxID=3028030 RepID=A0A9Y1I1Y7_9RHOD|nr:ORF47 [Sciadococcus taiwanensis]